MKKKFVVETVNTFYEVHLVEAETVEEAEKIAANTDYNASKWLGQQVANVSEFKEEDLQRLKQIDSYFFDGYASAENGIIVYYKMDGTRNGSMPQYEAYL
jgi:repressor of nif and glnA expression